MIYKKENATNPSKRFRSMILNPIGEKIKKRHFTKYAQLHNSVHHGIKLCKRRNKSHFKTKFNFKSGVSLKLKCTITQLSLARRHKTFINLVTYSNGAISCLPSFSGAYLSQNLSVWTFSKTLKLQTFSKVMVGSTIALGYLQITNCFFNTNLWFCKAGGTFCVINRLYENKGYCVIKLPSIKHVILHENTYVMLGRNSNILIRGIWLGKAGINFKKGRRPSVRGVAKNPVDHPHGGRTKSNSPEFTPWGKIAKYNK